MNKIPEEFLLKVYDQTGLIFEDSVVAVSAVNETGPLSILSGHTNFISKISGSLTEESLFAYLPDGTTRGFFVESGVVKVFDNITEVFLVLDIQVNLD